MFPLLATIYMALTLIRYYRKSRDYLKHTGDVHRLYRTTTSFYVRDLKILEFGRRGCEPKTNSCPRPL